MKIEELKREKGSVLNIFTVFCFSLCIFFFSACGVYSFKDVSIQPPNAKTIHIGYIENKARYVNPLLSPQLTDQLKLKISSRVSKLTQLPTSDADFDVSAYVTGYDPSTSGVSGQQAATNRLTVTVHIDFKNRLDDKRNFSADVTRNFDYSATLTLSQAEGSLLSTIVSNVTDEMFNRIFSNW